jgi:hypothetical protein
MSLISQVWMSVLDPDIMMLITVFILFVLYEDRSDRYVTNIEDIMVLRQNVASHNVYFTKRNCY